MQKVDRKPARSRSRLIWLLPAALLLAGSILLLIFLPEEEKTSAPVVPEVEEPEETGGSLVNRDDLVSVTITQRGEAPWTLTWEEDGAHLNGSEWIADPARTDLMEAALSRLVYADILTETPFDPAEYGLADPLLTAEAHFASGDHYLLSLGDQMPMEEGWYYMSMEGDSRLFAVSPAIPEDLDIDPQMLFPVSQPEIYAALLDRFTVFSGSGEKLAEWHLRGDITDQDAKVNWEVSFPFTYLADWERMQNLKTTAGNLRMGIFMAAADPETLSMYGLDEPDYVLEFHMAAGTTGAVGATGAYDPVQRPEATVTFPISRNDLVDYVLFEGAVYSVSHLMLSAFLDTDPMVTAARYPAPLPLNSLSAMTIGTDTYILDRTDELNPVCRKNGEEIPWETFEAAYERLLTVTVSGTLPEGAAWGEPHTRVTFTSVSGNTYTLSLSHWDAAHDALTLEGNTLFYLPQGSLQSFEVDSEQGTANSGQ